MKKWIMICSMFVCVSAIGTSVKADLLYGLDAKLESSAGAGDATFNEYTLPFTGSGVDIDTPTTLSTWLSATADPVPTSLTLTLRSSDAQTQIVHSPNGMYAVTMTFKVDLTGTHNVIFEKFAIAFQRGGATSSNVISNAMYSTDGVNFYDATVQEVAVGANNGTNNVGPADTITDFRVPDGLGGTIGPQQAYVVSGLDAAGVLNSGSFYVRLTMGASSTNQGAVTLLNDRYDLTTGAMCLSAANTTDLGADDGYDIAWYGMTASTTAAYDGFVTQQLGTSSVDATLYWKAGKDPNEIYAVNPDIVDEYIFMTKGKPTDPNFYYVGATGIDPGTSDPNSQYGPILNLGFEKDYKWVVVEAVDGYTQSFTPGVSKIGQVDPNNIIGPAWSFTTLSAAPQVKTPPTDVLANPLDDPTFVCVVECVTPLTAGNIVWDQNGAPVTTGISFADNGVVEGKYNYTSTLQFTDIDAADEGNYSCTVSNASGSDSASADLGVRRMVAYWPLDGNYLDMSGEGHDADPNVVPLPAQWTTDVPDPTEPTNPNTGLDFVPNNYAAADSGNWASSAFTGQVTVSAWVKWAGSNNAWQGIFSNRLTNTSGNANFTLEIRQDNGSVQLQSPSFSTLTAVPLQVGVWSHVAVTAGPERFTIYINGESRASRAPATAIPQNLVPAIIGANQYDAGQLQSRFNGILDDIRVYNYALTQLEVIHDLYYDVLETPICLTPPALDTNADCVVDLADFAELAKAWLECGLLPDCP